MALSSILPPGYRAFKAVQQQNEQSDLAELQKAQVVQGLLAKMQAQKQQQAYQAALGALPPDASPEQHVTAARPFLGPKEMVDLTQRSLDRKATTEAATATKAATLEHQKQFATLQHEARMRSLANDEARAGEVARHNKVMEGIQGEILKLRGEAAAQKPPPQGPILQTEQGPMTVRDGVATPITGPGGQPLGPRVSEKALPASAAQKLFENQTNLRRAENALALMEGKDVGEMKGDADATGFKGFLPDAILQRVDPKGTDARAALADLGSLIIHERSGAAVSASEFPRLQPFIPKVNDDPETVKRKLKRFAQIYRDIATETTNFYRESGFKVPELSGGAPAAPAPKPAPGKSPIDLLLEKYK